MKTDDLRAKFIEYFKKHKHEEVSSSRLTPENDPTLLFNNAGMNQFKNVFLGLEKRNNNRATSSQKCVRAGGKHNDLENVGHTARHHTFFEMLGNFSFGDYFKKEAIHFAWEFITKELKIPKDKLYVTVFEEDDEAAEIWHKQEKVPKDRIFKFGEKDNFWRMGASGPCGPCSEIFYDLGEDVGGDPKDNVMGGEGDRFMEIWNLVFMQYFESEDGTKTPLPSPSVDTGMGLERMAAVMQNELSNYHTDNFRPILDDIGRHCKGQYIYDTRRLKGKELEQIEQDNVAYRVLADHARTSAFLIADGVLPSNEGRGYVLRRIMRRAIRYGQNLSKEAHLLPKAVEKVIEIMHGAYPELKERSSLILTTVKDEEKRFLKTLDQGVQLLECQLEDLKKSGDQTLSGEFTFKLYDTYGFPADLTRLMAAEKGFEVDEQSFESQMQAAKEKARSSWKTKGADSDQAHIIKVTQEVLKKSGGTEFTGYDGRLKEEGNLVFLSDGKKQVKELKTGDTGFIFANKTCFYAEGGGQTGDTGEISGPSGQAQVFDCTKSCDIHIHFVKVVDGTLSEKDLCSFEVNAVERRRIAANHSATHLMHAALRSVLGTHVQQSGSSVESQRLRFDFTHNHPLSEKELEQIELLVNREISTTHKVATESMTPKAAQEAGALALFGEKYGDEVRVVQMGGFSMELCGGTHVENTAMIRLFKIVSETGVSSGVRRIEAVTGDIAAEYALKNTRENLNVKRSVGISENWNSYLEQTDSNLVKVLDQQREEIKNLQQQLKSLKGGQVDVDQLIADGEDFGSGRLVVAELDIDDRQVLSELTDKIRDKIKSGVVIVLGQGTGTHPLIVSVSKDLTKTYPAGKILKELAAIMDGKGGGRPDFAQGAVPNRDKSTQAFAKARELLQ